MKRRPVYLDCYEAKLFKKEFLQLINFRDLWLQPDLQKEYNKLDKLKDFSSPLAFSGRRNTDRVSVIPRIRKLESAFSKAVNTERRENKHLDLDVTKWGIVNSYVKECIQQSWVFFSR